MPLETGTTIADLDATSPKGGEPKARGDDHIRLVKTILKATFPAFTGPMPIAHDQIASKEYVMQQAFQSTLPAQTGNAGKVLSTDGTTASWQPGFPDQTGNFGKFLTTSGTGTGWSDLLNTNVVRLFDGTNTARTAAFNLAGLSGARNFTLPDASGRIALTTDVTAAFPELHVRYEVASGTSPDPIPATTWTTRFFNTVKANGIPGSSLSNNIVVLPAGTYEYLISAMSWGGGLFVARLFGGSGVVAIGGNSYAGQSNPVTWGVSIIRGRFTISATTGFQVQQYQQTSSFGGFAVNAPSTPEVYTEAQFRKIA